MTNNEMNKLIKDIIAMVKYETNISWFGHDIQESVQRGNYEKVANYGAEISKQSKALVKLKEQYNGCKVAEELYELILNRNSHMLDRLTVKFIKDAYGYVLDQI